MPTRTPYPAKSWSQIQKANKALDDERIRRFGGAAFDMACDIGINDPDRISRFEREKAEFRKSQERAHEDIQAACLLLGVREGSLGIKDGKVFGATSIEQVDVIACKYPACLRVWNPIREANGLPSLALLVED